MSNKIVVLLLKILIVRCFSHENVVRFYENFGEIHRNYDGPIRFGETDWENIKIETIRIRSDDENSTNSVFERRIRRINRNSTGKIVFARRFAEQKKSSSCELIFEDKQMAVVRELETGFYFRVPTTLIDYPEEPQIGSFFEVSFLPKISNQSLIVCYAVKNLRWQPRYQLETFPDGRNKFEMFADFINTSPFKFEFNQTELMTGDLNVVFAEGKTSSLIAPSKIDELNAVRIFSKINDSLLIDGNSILTIPISSPTIDVRTLFTFHLVLPNSNGFLTGKNKFNRLFQLNNFSTFLPSGHLLIYDSTSNLLSGEWQLPTLTSSEKYEFELGQDPELIFIYNRTVSTSSNNNSSRITTTVLVQNYKNRRVQIRFKSSCQISFNCLFQDEKSRNLGARLRYNLILDAKSEVAFTFFALRIV